MKRHIVAIRQGYERARFEFDDKQTAINFLEKASENYSHDNDGSFAKESAEFIYFTKEEEDE